MDKIMKYPPFYVSLEFEIFSGELWLEWLKKYSEDMQVIANLESITEECKRLLKEMGGRECLK